MIGFGVVETHSSGNEEMASTCDDELIRKYNQLRTNPWENEVICREMRQWRKMSNISTILLGDNREDEMDSYSIVHVTVKCWVSNRAVWWILLLVWKQNASVSFSQNV